MKGITILTTVLILLTIITKAQIPNSGFENWTTAGSYENPTGWATYNSYATGSFHSCTKSTDHYPVSVGNYSIRLENNTSLTQMTGGWGMTITDTMAYPIQPSFPVVGHPNSLCGYYKYNSLNNDSLFIRIILFANGTPIVNNMLVSGITKTSWTSFNIPLSTYTSADSATILIIAFYPNGPASIPKGNSVLYIDNLNFDNLISSVSEQHDTKTTLFNLYPNPAFDIVNLNINNLNKEDLEINIYNIIGKLIRSVTLQQNQQQINTGDLSDGNYIVEIISKEWTKKQRLIIHR